MFIELIDSLRCPRSHEDTWLVGSFDRLEEREVISGRLGCPICRAEFPIEDGVVRFDLGIGASGARPEGTEGGPSPAAGGDPGEAAMRAAALLGLTEAGGLAILARGWAAAAPVISRLVEGVQLLLLDPPTDVELGDGISAIVAPGRIPLAAGAARGVALDEDAGALLADAVRVLRPKGRLVAPAALPVPEGVTELARDATAWVAEREAAARMIALGRARRDRAPGA